MEKSDRQPEADPTVAERRPQPPLTEEQIEQMNARRYPRALSKEEIEYINQARARGIHYDIV